MEIWAEVLRWMRDDGLLFAGLVLVAVFLWRSSKEYLNHKLNNVARKEDLRRITEIAETVKFLKARETEYLDARCEMLFRFYDAVAELIYGLLSGPTAGVPVDQRDPAAALAEFGASIGQAQASIMIAYQRLYLFLAENSLLAGAASALTRDVLAVGATVGERMRAFDRARWSVDIRKDVLDQLQAEGGVTEAFAKGTIEAVDEANAAGRELVGAIESVLPGVHERFEAFNLELRAYLREERKIGRESLRSPAPAPARHDERRTRSVSMVAR